MVYRGQPAFSYIKMLIWPMGIM